MTFPRSTSKIKSTMLDISTARLIRLAAFWVGNKSRYEGINIPKQTLVPVTDIAEATLLPAMLRPFEKTEEFFYFHHEEDVSQNAVYQSVMTIFEHPENISAEAAQIAERLYEYSERATIKGGEFFVAYFEDMLLQGEPVSGIGLWKVQAHDNFLRSERTAEGMVLSVLNGIPTGKPEVAALILNLDEAEGYRVYALDKVSKADERSFWKDDVLRLRSLEDDYFATRHYVTATAEFIQQKGRSVLGLDAAQSAAMLNRVGDFFKDSDVFNREHFAAYAFGADGGAEAYTEFLGQYAAAYTIELPEEIRVVPAAVKAEAGSLRINLKLDKNFVLNVRTSRTDLIERGFDEESGRKFYKVYFENEE